MEIKQIGILHIDTEFGWRGGQQQVAYLLENLHKKGFHTCLICQPQSEFSKFCKRKKIPYISLKMHNEADIIAGLKIARICYRKKFRILHLHSAHALAIGIWAKLFYRELFLISVRRVDFHIRNAFSKKFKYNNNWMNRIVCISNGIRKVLLEDGIEQNKLVTIHSGIDIHKFDQIEPGKEFREMWKIPANHLIVGTVAAIVGHKDYPNLLKTAKIVLSKIENLTFIAVGTGIDESKIKKMASDLNLGKRFIFAGFQENVGLFLKNFDVFVLASKLEGLGTSILDALSVGLPVIACNVGGIPEIVRNNHNGFLVPSQNDNKLAKAMLALIQDQESRKRFGKNALEFVKKFDINITIQKNLNLYNELLK
ncbi:MAG TPA: glycosyltransferase family 1 protein [Candidatus Cloacimonetes bacterium]|nr:glycosyltransferase family 1 protein [Candidatus Cloacimonadota bacterium]